MGCISQCFRCQKRKFENLINDILSSCLIILDDKEKIIRAHISAHMHPIMIQHEDESSQGISELSTLDCTKIHVIQNFNSLKSFIILRSDALLEIGRFLKDLIIKEKGKE